MHQWTLSRASPEVKSEENENQAESTTAADEIKVTAARHMTCKCMQKTTMQKTCTNKPCKMHEVENMHKP